MRKILTWKKYHRWVGLVMSVFMLVFCVSGIILNHRSLFRECEVSRSLLPLSYHVKNFNNGIVRGTLAIGGDSVLAYGCAGVWLTDKQAKAWKELNAGLPKGVDNRNVRNMVMTKDGDIWMATQYDIFRLCGTLWKKTPLADNDTRITDIALNKDSSKVVILSRDAVFFPDRRVLKAPNGYAPKTTLFRTVWKLHSGEFFGLPGKLVVDVVAMVLIVISVTGILIFILPYGIRRQKRKGAKNIAGSLCKQMTWNQRWHNRLGYFTLVLTLWLAVTGMCLRPPLMIPLVLVQANQKVEDDNVWKDKLRAIRWDASAQCWIVSTSDGFVKVDENLQTAPVMVAKDKSPEISPMGINVFEKNGEQEWLVGSFSGMYRWNPQTGIVLDYFTGKPTERKSMRPLSTSVVAGYSKDFLLGKPMVFDYSKGTGSLPMPDVLKGAKMSLWNVALELHVGRCYAPFLGPFSDLFVFVSGLLISLTLLSGYVILRRRKKRKTIVKIISNSSKIKVK